MIVAACQYNPAFGQVDRNSKRILELIGNLKCELLVLPELALTGYNFRDRQEASPLAEDLNGPTSALCKTLSELTGSVVVSGFIRKHNKKKFNSAMAVYQNDVLGTYDKVHLYGREKIIFDVSETGFKVMNLEKMKLGIMICFDWIFPESMRTLALMGAQIIAHPANLVLPWCQDAMKIRCMENRVFGVTANRIGTEVKEGSAPITFTGKSQITSYNGDVIARAPENEEMIIKGDAGLSLADDKWITDSNHIFRDRRPEFYAVKSESR